MKRHFHSGWLALALVAAALDTARADFSFTNGSRIYTLVTTARTWANAQTNAVAQGGTLARIDNADENQLILTNLLGKGITNAASDGGGSVYVWIGGRETVEGRYVWTNRDASATSFWTGGKNGGATNGLYANWGRGTYSTSGPEPDNSGGTQSRAGFALEAWPKSASPKIGQPGQWNDINSNNVLAFLVERSTAPPIAPSNFVITVTTLTNLSFSWSDASTDEAGFEFYMYLNGIGYYPFGSVGSNLTSVPHPYPVEQSSTYYFGISAWNSAGLSDLVTASVTTPGIIMDRAFAPAVVGQPFSYTVTAGWLPDAYSVTGPLPPGLSFNTNTHQISGTPNVGGVFPLTLSAHYPAWGNLSAPFMVRVIYPPGPPVATAPLPLQTLATNGPSVTVPLNSFFTDRDTEKAARFVTSKGNFDLALYASATPQTVSNFLNYVNRAAYSNSIIQRVQSNFVMQGGGYKPASPNFTAIPTDPSPTNEPGIQQVRGTVAMAKQGGSPHSATDQWFVNLKDNSAELDEQNEGFAAFARVCGNGMATVDAIVALPATNYTVIIDGVTNSNAFASCPMNTAPPAPATMDQSKLVIVNSATQIQPLAYTVTATTVTGLVLSAVNGTNLVLTPASVFGGSTILTIRATDLDGNTTFQSVTCEVATAYSAWQRSYSLQGTNSTPGADGDRDTWPNAVEFALMGSPMQMDAASFLPAASIVPTNSQSYAALAFKLRKNLSGATVVMQVSPTLMNGGWTTVWTSADLGSAQITRRVDLGDHWLLTVRDATPLPPAVPQRFLRLLVNVPQ